MKKMHWFRSLLCLLSAVFVLSAFAGCKGDKPNSGTNEESRDTNGANTGDGNRYDAEGYLKDSIPSNLKYDDGIKILGWNSEVTEFEVEDSNEQIVDRAVWRRNKSTEERLNVTLNYTVTKGDVSNISNFKTVVQQAESSGAAFDVVAAHSRSIAVCAASGLLLNLGGIQGSHFDFDAPWWNQTIIDQTMIGDVFYYVTGDIAPSLVQMIYCVYFNADLVRSLELESPYDLVDRNEWTLENMMSMTENFYQDLNRNLKVDDGDRIPVGGWYYDWPALLHGCGIGMAARDDTGNLVIDPNLKGAKGLKVMQNLQDWVTLDNCFVADSGNPVQTFLAQNSMFLLTMSGRALMSFSSIKFEYACVPMPKYDSEQKNYISTARQPISLFGIQKAVATERLTMVTAVMECMASQGYRETTPVIFETVMQYQKSKSPEMSRMLTLIRDTAWFDFARIYSYDLDMICDRPGRYLEQKQSWSGYVNGTIPTVEKKLDKLVADLAALAED